MYTLRLKVIIITGHNGFVGSHLVKFYQSKNYDVAGISKKSEKELKIKQIKKDIRKITSKDIKGDVFAIIHTAGITNYQYCQNHPSECFETNILGTLRMLEIAKEKKCKFIFLSSSHVYGKPQTIPIKENHPTIPTSVYASSKIAGEICCESYSKSYNMKVAILRPFSIYGTNEAKYFLIPTIFSQLRNKKIIKLGNVYPKRDFIFIDDVINAISIVLQKLEGFEVYNIGTGKSYSVLELCRIIEKISKKNLIIKSIKSKSRGFEVKNMVSDSSKIKKLGWRPKISINQGLKILYDSYFC